MALQSPQVAAGGLADLGIVEEASYGRIPPNPSLQVFRRRTTSLTLSKDAYTSEEVRSDRMTSDARHGIRRANGDIAVEVSPGSHEMAWEAVMGGIWEAPADIVLAAGDPTTGAGAVTVATADDPEAGTVTFTLTGADFVARGFREGDTITFAGTGSAALNGENFTIVGIDPATPAVAVTVAPPGWDFDATPASQNAGTLALKGARVRMGNVYRSFTLERAFSDIGSFITFRGERFNTASVDLPPTGIATATFGLLGHDADPIRSASIDGTVEIVLTQADLGALTFDAGARTITAAGGDFALRGITAGDKLLFDGPGYAPMPQNRNARTVVAVAGATITVAEAIASGTTNGDHTVTRVGLPDYLDAPTEEVLVAVSGVLVLNGRPVGTVTAASLSIDNGMAGSPVVGRNTVPVMNWGNRANISGSMTVLFDRGGAGAELYNAFDEETEVSLILRMDQSDGSSFMGFALPRVKINSGSIGDAVAEGLPVSVDYMALKPKSGDLDRVHDSQLVVYDATVAA